MLNILCPLQATFFFTGADVAPVCTDKNRHLSNPYTYLAQTLTLKQFLFWFDFYAVKERLLAGLHVSKKRFF